MFNTGTKDFNLGHPIHTLVWVASKKPVVFCPSIGHVAIQPNILSRIGRVIEVSQYWLSYPKCLVPSQQFGFKTSLGCDHALYSLVSVLVGTESSNDSHVLEGHDLTHAFNSSIHEHILLLAAQRGVQACVIKPFDSMYSSLQVRIKLPNVNYDVLVESDIPVKKGIRQGVVNSPDLFNNSVIEAQYKAPATCILYGIDVLFISYADDILNISRTLQRIKSCFSALTDEYSCISHLFYPTKMELLFF